MATITTSPKRKLVEVSRGGWRRLPESGSPDRAVVEVGLDVDPEIKQPDVASRVHDNGNLGPRFSFLGKLAKPLLAFHHSLAGPPMSDRERLNRAVAEARVRRYPGLTSSWWNSQ